MPLSASANFVTSEGQRPDVFTRAHTAMRGLGFHNALGSRGKRRASLNSAVGWPGLVSACEAGGSTRPDAREKAREARAESWQSAAEIRTTQANGPPRLPYRQIVRQTTGRGRCGLRRGLAFPDASPSRTCCASSGEAGRRYTPLRAGRNNQPCAYSAIASAIWRREDQPSATGSVRFPSVGLRRIEMVERQAGRTVAWC
jgi:hypothetical protein